MTLTELRQVFENRLRSFKGNAPAMRRLIESANRVLIDLDIAHQERVDCLSAGLIRVYADEAGNPARADFYQIREEVTGTGDDNQIAAEVVTRAIVEMKTDRRENR